MSYCFRLVAVTIHPQGTWVLDGCGPEEISGRGGGGMGGKLAQPMG